jgi:hypothetical protein
MPLSLRQRDAFRRFFSDEESLATTLVTILIDIYGTEALAWEPPTIAMELAEDLGITIPRFALDRLMTAKGVVTSDDFYKRLAIFNQYCQVFAGDDFNPESISTADPFECAWGVTEAVLLAPPEADEAEPFSEEICAFIGAVLDKAGITDSPDVLQIAIRDSQRSPDFGALALDDPMMFGGEWQQKAEQGEDIKVMLRETLDKLIKQLSLLPLENGDTRELVNRAIAASRAE